MWVKNMSLSFHLFLWMYKATIPIAVWSERYKARRYPLLAGLLSLIGSQILFMEAPSFAVMCIARMIQGVSSSVIWVVGLAFLYVYQILYYSKSGITVLWSTSCDGTPRQVIGSE